MSELAVKKQSNNFASRFGAIMSIAGMCVGMGNVWRMPYMVGAYGGGAFVIAYLICVVVVVAPFAILEAGIGKGLQSGMMGTYSTILKKPRLGKVIGGAFSLGYWTMNFYFFTVIAGAVYFAYVSATKMWNKIPADQIYSQMNANPMLLAAVGAILAAICAFVLYKGVESGIEAISKVMVPCMIIFFVIAIVFAIFFVDNIAVGYEFMFKPRWKELLNFDMWTAAMSQACFSIGIGAGCVLTYGSHLSQKSDVTLNMLTVCLLDTSIGVLAGMAIIPTCVAMGLNPESGSGLIFIVLPSLLQLLPLGSIIGILVFAAIFFAGITSAFAQQEVAVVSFSQSVKGWTRTKACVVFGVLQVLAAVAAAYSTKFFDFWNNFSGNYVFVATAGVGAIVFGYMFGVEKIRTEFLNSSSDIKVGKWYTYLMKFVSIPVLIIMLVNSLFPFL